MALLRRARRPDPDEERNAAERACWEAMQPAPTNLPHTRGQWAAQVLDAANPNPAHTTISDQR